MTATLPVSRLFVAAVAATLIATTAGAFAAPGHSFATGGFQGVLAGGANENIAFSAQDTSAGVVGHLSETIVVQGQTVSRLRGRVVCLAISGNTAAIGFEVLDSSGILTNPYTVGSIHSLLVRDDDDAGDTFGYVAADCAGLTVGELFPISHGNITVRT